MAWMSEELEQVVVAVAPDNEFRSCAELSVDELVKGHGAVDDVSFRQCGSSMRSLEIVCCFFD